MREPRGCSWQFASTPCALFATSNVERVLPFVTNVYHHQLRFDRHTIGAKIGSVLQQISFIDFRRKRAFCLRRIEMKFLPPTYHTFVTLNTFRIYLYKASYAVYLFQLLSSIYLHVATNFITIMPSSKFHSIDDKTPFAVPTAFSRTVELRGPSISHFLESRPLRILKRTQELLLPSKSSTSFHTRRREEPTSASANSSVYHVATASDLKSSLPTKHRRKTVQAKHALN